MLERIDYLRQIDKARVRSPVTALLGPRQCGKTTIARAFSENREATFFDLESEVDLRRLANPEMVLGTCRGLVVLDEIQRAPNLFNVLRVLVDRADVQARLLILGSASPDLTRGVSESLAGRVEFVEMAGFGVEETGTRNWRKLWLRGGLPRSYLAASGDDSTAWREGFIRTFLERDIPQLGFEMKFSEAPEITRSMHKVVDDLRLDHLFVVCPSGESYPVRERISVLSLFKESDLAGRIEKVIPSRDRAGD